MDSARVSPPQDIPHHRPVQGGPRETHDTALNDTPEGLSDDAETQRPAPRALTPIPESEPLLLATGDRLARPNGRPPLHVQFDAQSPPVAGSVSSSGCSSSSDDDDAYLAEARPPDGGWGWVVVFASFMVNLIADGITFSFGVFFPYFLEYFGESKGKTAWIPSIFMAMPLLSGPIASFLTDRYGCRRVTVFGSLLAAFGFVISAFVDNIETLFITFGIMAGFGLSLCYVAAVAIVAYYFEKKRSLVTGISVCGSGIGTFIFAPLTHVLLNEYGWRGTTLILAGFFLNMAVCGLLFRDLPWTATMNEEKARERKRKRERKRNKRHGSSGESFSDSRSSAAGSARTAEADEPVVTSPGVPQFSSLVDLPTFLAAGGEPVPLETFELMSYKGRAYAVLAQHYPALMLPSRSFSDSGRLHELARASSPPAPPPRLPPPEPDKAALSLWLRRQQAAKKQPAFFKDLRMHRHSLTYRGAMLNINRYRLRASSCPNIFRNSMTTIAKEKLQWYAGLWDFWDLVVDVLDLSHLRNPAFAIFALSNFLLYMWYDVPYVYIADSVADVGFSKNESSMLISIIGIVNMFGEILLGWVGDWECVNPILVYAACMMLCGLVTALFPLLTSYAALASASGAFGAFIAANYSLTSIILVELITLEKFTNAYGLLLLLQGVANLIGTPLAGWLYDITESYDLSYYMAGLFIALSGLVVVVKPLINILSKEKRNVDPEANGDTKQNHVTPNGKLG